MQRPTKPAFGGPGLEPRWTSSTKSGVGTAYHTGSRLWFTLSHGIVNEVYFPTADQPNTRDFQLLITDGNTFLHEERKHLTHEVERLDEDALAYRFTNSDPDGRYRIHKEVFSDPHQPVLLQRVRLEVLDPDLAGKLRVFALLAPHVAGDGRDNEAGFGDDAGEPLLRAWRDGTHLTLGARPGFLRRSVGFSGASDGYQDLADGFDLGWSFTEARGGTVALTGELDLSGEGGVVLGLGFGDSAVSASCSLLQVLADPFDEKRDAFLRQWKRLDEGCEEQLCRVIDATGDGGGLVRLSRCVLLAHEDKIHQGAMIASLSIPWGTHRSGADPGGYHLVWPRDLLHSATALLAIGETATPRRAMAYLACLQDADGAVPQNAWLDGEPFWPGLQLDEVCAPVLLGHRLERAGACGGLEMREVYRRAASKLLLSGPVTPQERWEENSGYSPSTLATCIAALRIVEEKEAAAGADDAASLIGGYAAFLDAHVEAWTVTQSGTLVDGEPRHFVRIHPAEPGDTPPAAGDLEHAEVTLKNGGGTHPAKKIVDLGFLHLVRYGLRAADDPVIRASVRVADAVLRRDLPRGPGYLRYNHDGYGQQRDGTAYEGEGVGGCWPLLTGERGLYALAAGEDAQPYLDALRGFANEGGMLPEQLWPFADDPEHGLVRGGPTGSAMPLCWSHATYLNLARSLADGEPFDHIAPAGASRVPGDGRTFAATYWCVAHPVAEADAAKPLRILTDRPGSLRWSVDGWATHRDTALDGPLPGLFCAELAPADLPAGSTLAFARRREDGSWLGQNVEVRLRG